MGFWRRFVIRKVNGTSMQPTLRPGQIVVGDRSRKPQVGDVVLLEHPETKAWIIKRLTQIEGADYWVEGEAHDPKTAATGSDSWVFGPVTRGHIRAVVIYPRKAKRRIS
jgi:signal peptidase I